jgi:glutamate racemase
MFISIIWRIRMDNRPIGVFDSGFGGLTVAKEIIRELPGESIVYFGDNGRAPYGTKSKDTIIKFTFQNINFLIEQNIKMLVIACNTASACALEEVRKRFEIPVVEVTYPGAVAALRVSKTKSIGVIGTNATIESKVYEKTIKSLQPDAKTFSKACPMFVPLVEEGWWENEIAYLIAKEYLDFLVKENIDTLLLGCTHYPLLKNTISKIFNNDISIVSSDVEVARAVSAFLKEKDISAGTESNPVYKYFTSDNVDKFSHLGSVILGREIECVQGVKIEEY